MSVVTSGDDISEKTDVTITEFEIVDNSYQSVDSIIINKWYMMKLVWDASAYGDTLSEGDYFDLELPEEFYFPSNSSATKFDIYAPDGEIVAHAVVHPNGWSGGGSVRVTFTDYVNGRNNIKGTMYLSCELITEKVQVGEENSFTISIGSNDFTLDIGVDGNVQTPINPNQILSKWSSRSESTDDYVTWGARINFAGETFHNAVISDYLTTDSGDMTGVHYLPESFSLSERILDEYGNTISVVQRWNAAQLGDRLQFNDDYTSFTLEMGDIEGSQFQLVYRTSNVPEMVLRNHLTLTSTEKVETTSSSFTNASSGGTGEGDINETTTEETTTSEETSEDTTPDETTEEPSTEEETTTVELTTEEETTEVLTTEETTTVEETTEEMTTMETTSEEATTEESTTEEKTSEETTREEETTTEEITSEETTTETPTSEETTTITTQESTSETATTSVTPENNNNKPKPGSKDNGKNNTQKQETNKSTKAPGTGDNGIYLLFSLAMAAALSLMIIISILIKNRRSEKKFE